jgi:hypothetical protein
MSGLFSSVTHSCFQVPGFLRATGELLHEAEPNPLLNIYKQLTAAHLLTQLTESRRPLQESVYQHVPANAAASERDVSKTSVASVRAIRSEMPLSHILNLRCLGDSASYDINDVTGNSARQNLHVTGHFSHPGSLPDMNYSVIARIYVRCRCLEALVHQDRAVR